MPEPNAANARRRRFAWLVAFGFAAAPALGWSDPPSDAERLARLEAMLEGVAAENRRLAEQNRELDARYRRLSEQYDGLARQIGSTGEDGPGADAAVEPAQLVPPIDSPSPLPPNRGPDARNSQPAFGSAAERTDPALLRELEHFRAGYDDGFVIVPENPDRTPFRLRLNLQDQFRYTSFSRDRDFWVDSAGVVRPIRNRNDFEIVRGRVIFSGFALLPRLNYYVNLDYSTQRPGHNLNLLLGSVSYHFGPALEIYAGKGKVPGVREWIESYRYTLGADRTMATTFFRPSITPGIWARGELPRGLSYYAMVGNGFNTASLGIDDIDANLAFSGSLAWEPLGRFGGSFSDLGNHRRPVVRLGSTFTHARQSGPQQDADGPEETQIRLSDGTLLTDPGALAPGVVLTDYTIGLASVDLGLKYRGLSLTSEYFFRLLDGFRATGALPIRSIYDHGFYAQAGLFVVPERLELFARSSQIYGPYGDGSEYAGGFNWFILGTQNLRFTFDATRVIDSPAQQVRTDYRAGDNGMLFRAQIQAAF